MVAAALASGVPRLVMGAAGPVTRFAAAKDRQPAVATFHGVMKLQQARDQPWDRQTSSNLTRNPNLRSVSGGTNGTKTYKNHSNQCGRDKNWPESGS